MDDSAEMQNIEEKVIFGARVVNPSDPDVFDNPDSARVRARQIGCIGIRRYNNRSGAASWMPCTNESDYRRVSGIGHSGRRFRRQEIEREVRRVIGGRGGRKVDSKSANYTKPEVRETLKKRIMAGSKGGNPGQWSARKAQLLAIAYRKAGGGYKGGKTKKQRSLSKWTKQKWRTSDGKPARRGNVTRRYLPAAAWNRLTVGQRAATNRKKIQGSREGRQFVENTEAAKRARKRSTRGQKHIEFYEDFEFKAIGSRIGKVTRRRNFGSSTGGRAARRIGGKLRGAFATFDPNAIDADGDSVVQEGTIQERRIGARIAQAAQRAAASTPDNIGRIRRQPQVDEARAFGRAERLADGRYATTLPSSIARTQPSPRKIRRGSTQTRRIEETKPKKIRQSKRPETKPTTEIRAAVRDAKPEPKLYPPKYERDAVRSIRDSRPEIYRQFITGESTVAEIADRFDVVRDEIQQAINQHKKLRKSNRNKFTNNNPRLTRAIEKFSNSRNAFTEAISEGRFRDWDSMVQYVFRNPDSSKNRDNMVQDLFDTFKTGKNPDRSSNISLGYVPSVREDDKRLVKTFSDSRKPRPGFRGLDQFEVQPKRTTSAASFEQRTPRSYRRDDLIADAMAGGYTITGKMSGSMTPKQEQEWKRKEWKRQQLKGFAIDPNASTKFPSLNAVLAGRDVTKSIEALDALDDTQLDNLWTSTIGDISSVPGMSVPAYQAKNAPLSPRELALAASVKRPLVKAFVDEYKKFNAGGIIAGLDIDAMSDGDIQSFFNTFVLPELTNTGSPSVQDVEQAAQLLPTQARLSDAERLLAALPSSFQTLEYRMKVGRKVLAEEGYDVDTPEFDAALQRFLDESEQKDLDNFNEQLTTWLNGGKPVKAVKKIPINPDTNEPYTEQELRDQIDAVSEAIEVIQENFDPEMFNELQQINGISSLLNEAMALETFLNDPTKVPDESLLPINISTGKPYTLREWIESGAFKLFRMYDNPATKKPFTDAELAEVLLNLALQRREIENKIGPSILSDFNKLGAFNERLINALADLAEDDEDEFELPPGDLLDGEEEEGEEGGMQPDPPSIEEMQQANQDILDSQAERLQNRPEVGDEFTKDDVKNIRDTISSIKKNQEPTTAAPDTDEYWERFGPYDGDKNHPLNKVTDADGKEVGLNSKEYQVDKNLWNEYLAGNYAQEWSDIHNSHIIARYTDVPEELSRYNGEFEEGADPALIDPNIRWDKLIDVLQQTNPELFRKDPKTGEVVGETLDNLAQQLGLQNYGGASFSARAGRVTDASGEIIDTSGPQYRRLLGELAKDERLKQNEQYLGSTKAAAKERAKLWNLFEVGTLTPEEIAFQEEIRDVNTVVQALHMHEVDNSIPSANRTNLDGVARTAFQTRRAAFEKAKTKKLIEGIREIARLSNPNVSTRATASDLQNTIDRAITYLDETIKKIGIEYDQFRRTKQMLHGMISSLLKTRPGLFEVDPKNPNQRNRFGQTGWNRAKEPLLRYMNRIYKWNEEMFGYVDRRTGEEKPGLLRILVNYERSLALQTGDPAGSSSTTAIFNRARQRKQELERFKGELQSLSQQARSQGITGFMKGAGALGRAEDSARRGARRAAEGRFGFADPRILKRYDRAGFDVTKPMLGNASGFNKRFNREIQEAIRNNNQSMENSPAFNRLNQNEKSYMRLLEAVNNTPRLFGNEENPTRLRQRTGRVGQTGSNPSVRTPRYVTPFVNKRPTEFYKSGITGRMEGTSRNERIKNFGGKDKLKLGGFLEVAPEELEDGRWYMVNRHGEIMSPESYPNEDAAYKASLVLGRKFREQQRGQELPQNTAEWEAARLGLRQSGYRAASVHRQNLADIAPIKDDGTKNKYIFAVDKLPKQRAGDALILRKNPSTGELEALVIERGFGPHRKDGEGTVALPGGMFDPTKGDADLFDSALREALEETGLRPEDLISSQKLGTIDSPDWDPRFAEGIEVSAVLVEVPSTWEPTAGDDAESARFVPLVDLASGDIPLGFGHAAWFDAAFSAHEDPELSSLGEKFSHLNWLARQRQQRIIRDANELRVAYNAERLERDLTLFDQENPRLKLFPTELPDTTNGGWRPTGSEFDAISKPRVARIIKETHAHLDALINTERAKRGLPPRRTKRNFPQIPPGAVSGSMRAAMTEMGPDEFDKVSRLPNGRDNPAARKFIDDVINLRMTGMDKYSIAKFMSDKAALEFAVRNNGNSPEPKDLVRGHNSQAGRGNELAGLAPTDELIFRIISERKLSIAGNPRHTGPALRRVEPQDEFTKQRNDAAKDVMILALEGMSTPEIADFLDISSARVGKTLRRLGMQEKDGSTTTGDMRDVIRRYEQSPNQKALYVDSIYKRMSLSEISRKYKLPESEVRESVESYRDNVESLQPEHHAIYRKALTDIEADVLSRDEEQITRMRLDGLSISDISEVTKMDNGRVKTIEQRALYKLRRNNSDEFMGVKRELDVINHRRTPSMNYMVGGMTDIEGDGVYFNARDLRDFRNNDKDIYVMNQHMGSSVRDIASRFGMSEDAVRQSINSYSSAIEKTDTFKHKALRRVLATNNSSLSGADIDFINMRNDGASIDDIARYFEVPSESVRARQIAVMSKLNNSDGISGAMKGVRNIDSRNLYRELGVEELASQREIDDAFTFEVSGIMSRAMKNEPNSVDRLYTISEAYKVLSNPAARESYDNFDFDNNDDLSELPELDRLFDSWPMSQYVEPSTNKVRPPWVADAILGEYRQYDNFVKMPHHLGSDEITDDIDDGFLGFDINDSKRDLGISDMYYRRPMPGTREWDNLQREAEIARASGDDRFIFDEEGLIVGKRQSYIPKFDDPSSPDYVGDRYGGLPRGSSTARALNFGSPVSGVTSAGKKKISNRSASNAIAGRIRNDVISGQIQSRPPRDFVKRTTNSLKDDNRRYPFDSRPSESDMQLIESASQNLRQTELLPMAKAYEFEFSGPDGELYNSGILTLAQRPVVVVRFYDEINVPFYMSSGRGGKSNVEPGRWYPFWGVGRDGWFNKTTERDINNFYNIPELRIAAARLDAILPQSSMPTSNKKWNNGDLDWMPREKMSISERQKRFRDAQRAIREADESNTPDNQRRASRQESKKFVGFPIKNSLVPVINGRRNAIDRNGDVSLLGNSILSTRKKFNDVRKEILEIATQDRTSSRRELTNERAKRIVRDMPDGVFDVSVVGRMAIPRKQWSGRDFYKDLEADKNDSLAVLKKKFRDLAKKYHPDRNKGDVSAAARFRAASEAWEILSDARQRSDYDNNFYPEIERRAQQNQNQGNQRPDFPFGFTSQRDNQAPQEEPSETRPTRQAPPRPPYPNPRSGAALPPIDKTLSDRIGYVPPSIKHDPNLWDSMRNHRPEKRNEGIEVPNTFGQGTTKVTDERFFDLYTKVAVGMSEAVKKNRKPGEPKRFISVGGAPGSGKSTMRKSGEAGIPDVDSAVHVDADEIKTVIPEAVAAHAAGDTEWGTVAHEESRVISDMALRVALDRDKDVVYDSTGQYNRGYGTLDYAKAAGYEITAHYVVAPEEFLQERIDMRQLTDPRKLPRHIISATMARNFYIIPEVAQKSDEFYLWGWDGNKKVLLAQKEKGKTLEILDPRAFAHADFFEDYGDHPLVDRPDLSLFPNRRDLEFPSSWVYDAHKMFKRGATVSEIAKELKIRKSSIFKTLTEENVVGAPGTAYSWDSPFRPRSPREPDGPPRPIYQEDDITEDPLYTDEDIRDAEEDYYKSFWDDSPTDEDDMPIPGRGRSDRPLIPIDGVPPMSVGDPAPDLTRYKSSGILAEVAKSNEQLTTMFKYAKESTPFRKLISSYLRDGISDKELVDGLKNMRTNHIFATWAYREKSSLSTVWPFDDEKIGTLNDNEITEYAEGVLGDAIVKKLEQAFTEMSAVGVTATDPIGRKFAWEYGIPMDFMKSAQAKFNRKGTITGAMNSKNPFGDPSTWKSLDDLDDELKDYMVDDDLFGKAIKHPLLFWIGPVAPNMIDYLNNGIDAKRKGTEEAYKDKNWSKYIYLHERAYRIQAFEDVMDEMTDEQYWENLSSIWVDSESIGTESDRWLELLQSNRGSRDFFMNDDERAELGKLPNKFTVYRGYSSGDPEEFGMSWSTSKDVAEWFARRFARDEDDIILEELQVAKEEVFAYLTRRSEEEIILDMRIAKEKSVKRTKLGPKGKGK